MALATHDDKPPAPQAPMMKPAPKDVPADAPRPTPVLVDDIDPVLLVRLYPDSTSTADARAQAIAAGNATHAAGETLVAAQQQPA